MSSGKLSKYQQQQKGKSGSAGPRVQGQLERKVHGESSERTKQRLEGDAIDELFGFHRVTEGLPRVGWLLNCMPITMPDSTGTEKAGLDLYFLDKEGQNFKASLFYAPYFFVGVSDTSRLTEIGNFLTRKFEGCLLSVEDKEDLEMPNHLSGLQHKFIKLMFNTVNELIEAKSQLRVIVDKNVKDSKAQEYAETMEVDANGKSTVQSIDPSACIVDLREYDVPYLMRVAIDLDIRVGAWYSVTPEYGSSVCAVEWLRDMLELCEPRILAFDIECEKSPLKFPNAERDRIFMISYMVANQGYLLINREVVTEDIEDFEYTPKPSFPGPFHVTNLADEEAVLKYFLNHIKELRPHIFVTYNGDKFDWPYIEVRCSNYPGLSLYSNLGIKTNKAINSTSVMNSDSEYTGRCVVHLDAFCWVQRDSYLPQGNQGLKAVTKYKLGYDPVEVDPEDMLRFARERPRHMASYSVSDAVATYYLYTTYVHNFIFSLSTIIPLASEDVLRKGSGTLCEALLMVEAYKGDIVCPNKQVDANESFHGGHLLESETYIGGHVECLEAGVFRTDIPAQFSLVPSALQGLIDKIDRDLTFAIEVEHGLQRSDISNYDEVRQAIVSKLEMLRDCPDRTESPLIYHLDVGAMYPNIILTNRLQPSAMVSVEECASCKFNQSSNGCKRPMTWTWRGEYNPATSAEYTAIKRQLAYEKVTNTAGVPKMFSELTEKEQAGLIKSRLKLYSQRVYRKTKVTQIEERVSTVCMRENAFYVDTVKAFRDRRYDYKLLTKVWKNKKVDAEKKGDLVERKVAEDREVLMDSLQLAHKCILNSFYGYVMRKGARWRSMEMAGIVTHTGAQLIKQARELVEQVGRPLELDTDGIWCILPSSFPQDFKLKTKSGTSIPVGYPCAMLNADVHENYTNHQYQVQDGESRRYLTHSECSIFFELDGPYKAMVLPASPEEGRLLKKKYVVFNFNGTIAELKGFELKRRGELELVKIFQSQVFEQFLAGKSLQECYEAVGAIGNQWLDVLDEQGRSMDDDELLQLISEHKTISKTVDDYEGRKSTSLTTAARLADFLGAEMVKDKGLNCNLVISRLPLGAPVTERAIPVAIFSCEPAMRKYFLRKWMKDNTLDCEDFRDVIDWEYYKERLGKTIQKIITIPAGMQRISNPCPRVEHPPWLQKYFTNKNSGKRQLSLKDAFAVTTHMSKPLLIADSESHLRDSDRHTEQSKTATKSANKRVMFQDGDASEELLVDSHPYEHSKDMEDIASPKQMLVASSVEQGIEESKGEIDAASVNPLFDSPPTSMQELQDWLKVRKQQWRKARAVRKQAYNSVGTAGGPGGMQMAKRATGVFDFVRNASLVANSGTWQIIEIQELDTPGEFQVWAMTSANQLQRLSLVVPRLLYVNVLKHSKDAILAAEKLGGQRVKKELPHGKEHKELFEISLPEKKYQRNEKQLNLFFACSEVEGVYESQVPLWYRAIMRLGCVAKVNNKSLSHSNNSKYDFRDLDMVHVTSYPYLDVKTAQFRRIYVYFSSNKSRVNSAQGILGIFVVDSTNIEEGEQFRNMMSEIKAMSLGGDAHSDPAVGSAGESGNIALNAKAHVWLITGRSTSSTFESKPPFNKIYRKFQPNQAASVKSTTSFVSSVEEAFRLGNDRLEQYHRSRVGPTIVVAQGGVPAHNSNSLSTQGMDSKLWRQYLPSLHDFPLAVMPANSLDEVFPAVGWTMFAAERMIQRYLIFPRWFDDRLNCARYSHIPLCNLNTDALTTIIDVSFGRQLIHNRHLLWASEAANCPDVGQGIAADQDLWAIWSENLKEPTINNPSVSRNICVELDLYGLAICAIMSSGELDAEGLTLNANSSAIAGAKDEEGHDGAFFDQAQGGANTYSDASCGRAFSILKALVVKWVEEVTRRGERLADGVLTAVYRYLCGFGSGLLSDPLLHRVVYGFMVKLFWKLMMCLKSFGSQIVYADFNRIIIATNRDTLDAAHEYVDFILSAVAKKDTFAYLQLTIKTYWQQLVWLDAENFAGLLVQDAESEKIDVEESVADVSPKPDEVVENLSAHFEDKHNIVDGKDNAEDASEDEEDEEKGTAEATRRFDLDEDEGPYDFDLASIKKSVKSIKFKKSAWKSDYIEEDSYDDASSVEESKSKKRTKSINELLDSFEDGYQHPHGHEVEEEMLQSDEAAADLADPNLIQQWNVMSHLPEAARLHFKYIVSEFIYRYQEHLVSFAAQNADSQLFLSALNSVSEDAKASAVEEVQTWIEQTLTDQLFKIIDELNFAYSMALQDKNHAGKDLGHPSKTVPLDFVKAITHVLLLDVNSKDAVAAMRRLVLTQLQVQEFSAESQFSNPNPSYVLRDVICSYCNVCRDMDLLRDPALVGKDVSSRWRCSHCSNTLNREEVENRLLDEVEKLTASFLLQDFRCAKTKLASKRLATSLSTLCEPLVMDKPTDKVRRELNVLHTVSKLHDFDYLTEALDELLV